MALNRFERAQAERALASIYHARGQKWLESVVRPIVRRAGKRITDLREITDSQLMLILNMWGGADHQAARATPCDGVIGVSQWRASLAA